IGLSPMASAFGVVDVGSSSMTASFTVQNSGGGASGPLSTSVGPGTAFLITSDTCKGATLGGGASCSIQAQFKPAAYGAQNATLSVSGTPGGTATASLSGTGRDTVALAAREQGNGSGTVT